jgi:uncharacterized phage-associated protein
MTRAIDVAGYLIHKAAAEPEPEYLSPLRLQKLLYYVQGWNLAMHNRPLFCARIEAWRHGPVVREVYSTFADYGSNEIFPIDNIPVPAILSAEDRAMIDSIWEAYKVYSGNKLRLMTHSELPWVSARGESSDDDRSDSEITHESLRAFFTDKYEKTKIAGIELDDLRAARIRFESGNGIPFERVLDEFGMSYAVRTRTG